jgi:phenylalanyl-tRNA synthetase beta chain
MKISLRWLGRHVDLAGLSPAEVVEAFTIHTAEVEGLEPFAPWLGAVVVGHVVEREKHPDADKLSVCRVDVGAKAGGTLQIVCGAPNVAAGQRVAVAVPGVVLPGDFRIKKSKIRGVESCGMICSERELEISDEHSGIWVLPGEPEVGTAVSSALDLVDHVIEIDNKSLTHRPDLWGHRGLAGELAAITGRELRPLDLSFPVTEGGEPYPVEVTSAGCSRYIGLAIDGVKNGPAPDWMRFALLAVGQRSLDLLVDLSNFVMLDLGQPNHLFDRRRLAPTGIVVRDARPGERTSTLDGVERVLDPEDVLICSGDEVVAVGGVMGGDASKVLPDTTELLLEAAAFHPTRVRRTAARLGLRTDASARFEKHLDPTLPAQAVAHLVALLREIQPGIRLPRPAGDAGDWSDPAHAIALRPARVRAVLGADLDDDDIAAKLSSLGFGVERSEPWNVMVPARRATKDVGIEEDLIEEVGRLHGYGRIADRRLVAALEPAPFDARRALVRALQDRLAGGACFHEAMSYSFLDGTLAQRLGLADAPHVPVVNPLIEGLTRVRRSVVPSLLGHLEHNRRHHADIRLFEVGKGYRPEEADERGQPREIHELGLVWMAPRPGKGARFDANVLARLQGVLEDLLAVAERPAATWRRLEGQTVPAFAHPGRCMGAFGEGPEPLAWLAGLDPEVQVRLDLTGDMDGEVACAAVSIDALLEAAPTARRFRALPRYPAVKVDVAALVSEETSAGTIEAALEKAGKGLVERCELFDLYRGENLGAGKKSLAYHVVLRAADRTLDEKDGAKFLGRVERALGELGGELRRE